VTSMATRAYVEASIDSFWKEADRNPRAPSPQEPFRRHRSSAKRGAGGGGGKLPPSLASLAPGDKGFNGSGGRKQASGYSASAGPPRSRADTDAEDFKKVCVEIEGREGFNSKAVNGIWRFWKVKSGRLAFRREVRVESPEEEELNDADDRNEAIAETSCAEPRRSTDRICLFLHYVPKTDAWIISDAPDTSGCVLADCGPVGKAMDLEQVWRVWDRDGWKEDRNILAEVKTDDRASSRISGLRLMPSGAQAAPLSSRGRAASQDVHYPEPTAPASARLPNTARPDVFRALTPRQLDSAVTMV